MIESDFTDLSNNDIKTLIDKELSKDADEIDTDYVDLCFQLMSIKNSRQSSQQNHKRIKLSKVLLIAAAVAILLSIGITAYAKATDVKISDMFVQLFSDHATINYREKPKAELTEDEIAASELYQTLVGYGIENIMLPEQLYSMPFEINYENIDFAQVYLGIAFEDKTFDATVCMYKDENYIGNPNINGEFTASKKLTVNGVDVYLFERNGDNPKKVNTSISYMVGLTQYSIYCQYDIEKAEELVNQMK